MITVTVAGFIEKDLKLIFFRKRKDILEKGGVSDDK